MRRILPCLFLLSLLACCHVARAQAVGDFQLPQKVNPTGGFTPRNFAGGNSKVIGTNGSGAPVAMTLGAGLGNDGSSLTLDSDLVTWAGVTSSADGRSLVSAADYTAMRALMGVQPADADLTSIAALATTSYGRSFLTLADAAALRTAGGLVIGEDVQAYTEGLDVWAGIDPSFDVQAVLEAADVPAIRAVLGLGALATLSTVGSSQITDGAITNADVSASAGIAISKIDGLQGVLDAKANNLHGHGVGAISGTSVNRLFGTGGAFAVGQDISVSSPLTLSAGVLSIGNIDLTSKVTGTLPVANGGTGITSLGSGVSTLLGSFTTSNANAALTGDDFAFVGASNTFTGVQTMKAVRLNSSDGVYLRDGYEVTGDANQKGRLVWGHDSYAVSTQVEGYLVTLTKVLAGHGLGNPYYAGELVMPAAHQWDFRSGTNATAVTLYRTWTSTSNYEGVSIFWDGNVAHYKPVAGGGGGTVRTQRFWMTSTVWIGAGSGTPEAVETAGVGSIYTDTATGSVYRKTSGSGNTGWVTP